jgi:4-amino-4-deoxy-L-arabinose transferase-like glycosyltransferase
MTRIAKPQNIIRVQSPHLSDRAPFLTAGYVLVALLCLPLFFVGLGNPPLIDPDEPVYAATGRAMLAGGHFANWWSPHYNGTLWFDKPPMTYWLIGLSMKLFGPNAFAARLPSALCAAILVALTAYFAKKLWLRSTFAGIWAGLVIATSLQTIILARAAVTDMILAVLLTAAMLGMWNWLADERSKGFLILAGVATGLAALTKGPVAIVLVGVTVLLYLIFTKQAARLLSPLLWLSLLIAIAVALPWYASMIHEHGSLFINGFLEANNLTRYLRAEHPTTSSPIWFLPVLLGFIFPWSLPLVLSLVSGWKLVRQGDRAALFLIIWIVWVFIFFSASQTKLLTYIYPLYPMAAVLIGRWIDSEPSRKERITCAIFFAAIALASASILPEYISRGNGLTGARPALEQIDLVFVVMGVLTLLSLLPVFEWQRLRRQLVFAFPAICLALFFPLVALSAVWKQSLPDLALVDMAQFIGANTPPTQKTIALGLKRPSLVYYSSRSVYFTDDPKLTALLVSSPPYPYCAVKTTGNGNVLTVLNNYLPPRHYKIVLHSGLKYVLIKYQP